MEQLYKNEQQKQGQKTYTNKKTSKVGTNAEMGM